MRLFILRQFTIPFGFIIRYLAPVTGGLCLVLYTRRGVFFLRLGACLSLLGTNTLSLFFNECFERLLYYTSSSLAYFYKQFIGVSIGYSAQFYLKGIGYTFKRVRSRKKRRLFLKTSLGFSKKIIFILSKCFKVRLVKKLKIFFSSKSLDRLTLFASRFNLIKFRFFYKKFKGLATVFEKITVLKMNKGL